MAAAAADATTTAANTVSSGDVSVNHCTICGDDAIAFSFGVLSCESCTSFFRRHMGSNKEPVCLCSGNYMITVQTRHFCAACRLRKCQTAGMNKSLVLSDEQRRVRQERIDSNRSRKAVPYAIHSPRRQAPRKTQRLILPVSSVNGSPDVTPALPVLMADEETLSSEQLVTSQLCRSFQVSLNMASDQKGCNFYCSKPGAGNSASEDLPAAVDTVIPDRRFSECVFPIRGGLPCISTEVLCDPNASVFYQPPASLSPDGSKCVDETAALVVHQLSQRPSLPEQRQYPQPWLPHAATSTHRRLSSQTCRALDALTRLYKSKLAAARRSPLPVTAGVGSMTAVTSKPESCDADRANRVNHFAFRLSNLISGYVQFACELPDIVQLPIEARLALVKAGAPTFILIRAAELYDEAQAAWVDELGDVVPTIVVNDLLEESRREPGIEFPLATVNYCDIVREFLLAVKHQIPVCGIDSAPDRTVVGLLQAIALLSPELVPPGIVSGSILDVLASSQQHRICLLRQYLEATSSFNEAADWWPKLLSGVVDACKRAACHVSVLLRSCDAVRSDKLLMEIFLRVQRPECLPPSQSAVAE